MKVTVESVSLGIPAVLILLTQTKMKLYYFVKVR